MCDTCWAVRPCCAVAEHDPTSAKQPCNGLLNSSRCMSVATEAFTLAMVLYATELVVECVLPLFVLILISSCLEWISFLIINLSLSLSLYTKHPTTRNQNHNVSNQYFNDYNSMWRRVPVPSRVRAILYMLPVVT